MESRILPYAFQWQLVITSLLKKIDCYNKCANCWLCGCEELCDEVVITWQVVGYLKCMICHELA